MLSLGTLLQDRYRVLRELGHGGMGTVYEALDQRINCIFATLIPQSQLSRLPFK
jgi:serine/threonine protein kinase